MINDKIMNFGLTAQTSNCPDVLGERKPEGSHTPQAPVVFRLLFPPNLPGPPHTLEKAGLLHTVPRVCSDSHPDVALTALFRRDERLQLVDSKLSRSWVLGFNQSDEDRESKD